MLFFFMVGFLIKERLIYPSKFKALKLFTFYIVLTQLLETYNYIGTDNIDMHMNIIGNPFVYMIMGVFGSISLFFICFYSKILWIFKKLGQYTLFSFPFHSIVFHKLEGILNKLNFPSSNEGMFFLVEYVLLPFFTAIIMIVVCSVLEKYTPYLVGKYKYIKFR